MSLRGPQAIRVKVTLIALLATLAAAIVIVAVVATSAQAIVRDMVSDTLDKHLDKAQEAVELGNYEAAVFFAGSDVLQIIDANGKVIASSANAQGLPALASSDDDDKREIDDLEELAERNSTAVDDDDDDDEPARAQSSSSSNSGNSRTAATSNDDDDTDADDAHDADRDDEADDDDADRDDEADDNDNDDDEDEDDDDDDADASRGSDYFGLPAFSIVEQAFAAPAGEDAVSIEQSPSGARGTPFDGEGPFLVVKRSCNSPDGTMTLVGMTSLASAFRALQAAVQLLVIALVFILALVGVLSWRLSKRTLQPVEHMRAAAERIGADDLSARIIVPEQDHDLAPLARTFNEMLERVETTVNDQKRFVSDASHELKSPVAATGIILDALRAYPDSVDKDEALRDLTRENERMERIVNDLLVLARQDEGRTVVEKVPLDLYDLIMEEVVSLRSRSTVNVDMAELMPLTCKADYTLLSHSLRNLLDNAARYAASTVKISCAEVGDAVRITISDDGPGIAPEDRERVFGRFVRLEDSRSHKEGSTGLGLAVVKASIECQSGRVFFAEPEIGGATAVVELPVT